MNNELPDFVAQLRMQRPKKETIELHILLIIVVNLAKLKIIDLDISSHTTKIREYFHPRILTLKVLSHPLLSKKAICPFLGFSYRYLP